MRVFITGIRGQLGRALEAALVDHERSGIDLPECDVTDRPGITAAIADAAPDIVIHCAAMTDVDGCARDPDAAYRANGLGTQNVALACQAAGAAMLYVSTNEVFDGNTDRPYLEFDAPHPINAYGRSKLAGEWYTRHLLIRFYIVRTAWLYAPGGRNFPHRIMQLADERGRLWVVTDEISSPTYVVDLVQNLQRSVRQLYDIHKLRFLLYPSGLTARDADLIHQDDAGVIWLGKDSARTDVDHAQG